MKLLFSVIFILANTSLCAFDFSEVNQRADSILKNYVGECFFEAHVVYHASGLIERNSGQSDIAVMNYWVAYYIGVYDQKVQKIQFDFNSDLSLKSVNWNESHLYITHYGFDPNLFSNNGFCQVIPKDSLKAVIREDKISNKRYRNRKAKINCMNSKIDFGDIYLTENGLVYEYTYRPKSRNGYGVVEISLHSGEQLRNFTTSPHY